jgi:hypothetical protein
MKNSQGSSKARSCLRCRESKSKCSMEEPESSEVRRTKKTKKADGEVEAGLRALLEKQGEVLGALVAEVRRLRRRVEELEGTVGCLAYAMETEYEGSGSSEGSEESEESEMEVEEAELGELQEEEEEVGDMIVD